MIRGFMASWLFAVAPLLFLAAHNAGSVRLGELTYPAMILCASAAVLASGLHMILKDHRRVTLGAALFWGLFFSYGEVCDLIWNGKDLEDVPLVASLVGVSFLAILVAGLARLLREKPIVAGLADWLTATASLAVLFSAFSYAAKTPWGHPQIPAFEPLAQGASLENMPDIYHIILDGYADRRTLRDVYDYHDTSFTDGLEQRGFTVLEPSYSNYTTTFLSLASMLNYKYHRLAVSKRISELFFSWQIQNSRVARELISMGYEFVLIGANWVGTQDSEIASRVYRARNLLFDGEFASVFWRLTPLRHFEPGVAKGHLYAFEKLVELADDPAPKFVLAHIPLPHNPYVFDAEGGIIQHVPPLLQFDVAVFSFDRRWGDRHGYIEQLIFTGRKTLDIIDRILERSPRRPVIIVQSDHGSAARYGRTTNVVELARERNGILNAILAPVDVAEHWPVPATAINTYPVLFRSVFNRPVELLPDRMYYSWYDNPIAVQDVTDALLEEK